MFQITEFYDECIMVSEIIMEMDAKGEFGNLRQPTMLGTWLYYSSLLYACLHEQARII